MTRSAGAALLLAAYAAFATAALPDEAEMQRNRVESERLAGVQLAGAARDPEALRALVRARDIRGIDAYTRGFLAPGGDPMAPLPEAVESLVVTHFADPVIGGRLASLVRGGTYATRPLFDLLLAATRERFTTGRFPPGFREAAPLAVRTLLPGVEGQFHALLIQHCALHGPAPGRLGSRAECDALAYFLGRRRHESTRTWLLAQISGGAPVAAPYPPALRAVGAFGDRQSADFLLAQLEKVAASPGEPRAADRAFALVVAMQGIDATVALDEARVRRAVAAIPGASERLAAVARSESIGKSRGDAPRTVASLMGMPLEPKPPVVAAKPAPRPAPPPDPAREEPRVDQYDIGDYFDPARAPRMSPEQASAVLRGYVDRVLARTSPARDGRKSGIDELELLIAVGMAARHERFVRRNPRAAVDLYRMLLDVLYTKGDRQVVLPTPVIHVRIADILHFDLGDRTAAAREIEVGRERLRGASRSAQADAFIEAMAGWLAAEAGYLRDGRTARGAPSREAEALFEDSSRWLGHHGHPSLETLGEETRIPGRPAGGKSRAQVLATIASLPPSRDNVPMLVPLLGNFQDEASMRQLLAKHDPAGFATVAVLGQLARADRDTACGKWRRWEQTRYECEDRARPHAAQEAARKILASRGAPIEKWRGRP